MIFDFLVSDYPILLTIVAGLWFLGSRNRSVVSWMWNDRAPAARVISRAAISALFAFALWATVFDNWRQLLGYLVDAKNRWRSDPFLYAPPADAVRLVTWLLLGAAALGGAYLYARYARGYLIPVVVWPLALVTFYALNAFRMRFELVGPLSPRSVDFSNPLEAIATFVWFGSFYVVMALLILCAYTLLWSPAAIVLSVLYRATIGRETIEEPEMFRLMRERSSRTHSDAPGSPPYATITRHGPRREAGGNHTSPR